MDVQTRTRSVAAGVAALVALGVGGVAVATANPLSPLGRQSTTEPADPAPGEGATTAPDEAPTTDAPPSTEAPPATEAPVDEDPAAPAPDADAAPDDEPPAADDPTGGAGTGRHGGGHLSAVLDELVADGVITREQADAILDALAERGGHGPFGHGPFGHGLGLDAVWEAASEITGLPADALRDGLAEGRSLAEIAEDEGVGRDALVDALVARVTEHLDEAVDAGWLTRERADALAEGAREHVERLVDLRRPRR